MDGISGGGTMEQPATAKRGRTPHAAAGDHHLEEEEERGAIGAGSQVRRERKEIETAAIQKIEGNGALQSRERSICCSAD